MTGPRTGPGTSATPRVALSRGLALGAAHGGPIANGPGAVDGLGTTLSGVLGRRPVLTAAIGAACISSSAVIVQVADSPAGTAAFLRCALALPGLAVLSALELRRSGAARTRPARSRWGAVAAGAFLGIDLVLWTHAIYDVGAGIATVLGNLQVLFVAFIAWAALKERPGPRFVIALPVVGMGVVLVAGLLGERSHGDHHPAAGILFGLGTSLAYGLFILVLRQNAGGGHGLVATPLAEATAGAAASSLVLGLVLGELDLSQPLRVWLWLLTLALASQTAGWLFITSALPRLSAAVSSLLLLLQPAATLLLAAVALGQQPSWSQVAGAVLVCGGVLYAARSPEAVTDRRAVTAGPPSSEARPTTSLRKTKWAQRKR